MEFTAFSFTINKNILWKVVIVSLNLIVYLQIELSKDSESIML